MGLFFHSHHILFSISAAKQMYTFELCQFSEKYTSPKAGYSFSPRSTKSPFHRPVSLDNGLATVSIPTRLLTLATRSGYHSYVLQFRRLQTWLFLNADFEYFATFFRVTLWYCKIRCLPRQPDRKPKPRFQLNVPSIAR
jgi:hypothetical protein